MSKTTKKHGRVIFAAFAGTEVPTDGQIFNVRVWGVNRVRGGVVARVSDVFGGPRLRPNGKGKLVPQ